MMRQWGSATIIPWGTQPRLLGTRSNQSSSKWTEVQTVREKPPKRWHQAMTMLGDVDTRATTFLWTGLEWSYGPE